MVTAPGILVVLGGPYGSKTFAPVMRSRVAFTPAILKAWEQADAAERDDMLRRFGGAYCRQFLPELTRILGPVHGEVRVSATTIDDAHPAGVEWLDPGA